MTGNALLASCFQDIGILAPGETLNPDDAAVGLTVLQNFIDSLGTKRATMFARARNALGLTSGQQSYTIGSGGNLNTARPMFIDEAMCRQVSSGGVALETPVTILTQKEYAYTGVKAITTGIVTALFYDYGWAAGLGTITVYPYPSVAGLSLVLYGPVAVVTFSDLVTDVTFPPGYAELLEYNVAKRLAIKYPKGQLSPLLLKMADDAMHAIMSGNWRPEVLGMDPALTQKNGSANSYWSVLSGQ